MTNKGLKGKKKEQRIKTQDELLHEQMKELNEKTWTILNKAEESEDLKVALMAIKEAWNCLTISKKLEVETKESHIEDNIYNSPQWIELRTVILKTLEPFAEARLALSEALEAAENG